MLHNMTWLGEGQPFPPISEVARLDRYAQNRALFNGEHFSTEVFRYGNEGASPCVGVYDRAVKRIEQVVGNFSEVISFPVLLNYQRFMSTKMADLVAGEHPLITGKDDVENNKLKWITDSTDFFNKLYSVVIDMSRYGDAVCRVYKNEQTGYYDWTLWDAGQWFPIVTQDGTDRIHTHVLAWIEDRAPSQEEHDYFLHAQEFRVDKPGEIREYLFYNGANMGTIGATVEGFPRTVSTGFTSCPVFNLRPYAVSGTVFGYDDYMPIDAVMAEIIARVSQISVILDKHADPSMTGPTTLLRKDPVTGELVFERSKFYGTTEDQDAPEYLTWDGQLEAAFKQLEFLVNQLYTLSEMGAAITGGIDSSGNAVSGTAMRFKMVNPLAKARRVTNSLTTPMRRMLAVLGSNMPDIDEETAEPGSGKDTELPFGHVTITWKDGLPDDPREGLENCKLASGETKMLPLEYALMEFLGKSPAESVELAEIVRERAEEAAQQAAEMAGATNPNKPGPQNGTGVNPSKKGSKTGVKNFQSETNKTSKDK